MVLDFIKNALYFFGVFNQRLDRGGKQGFETPELMLDSTGSWFVVCHRRSWFDGFRVEREQAREVTTLTSKNSIRMRQKGRVSQAKEYTSPESRGTADDEGIGSCVAARGWARLATLSAAGATGSRFAEGICTSSTPPLEVSSVCKRDG
jgi:hypothetical protein